MFFDDLYESCKKRAVHTIWVMSDLQQSLFENAKKCLDTCMEDYNVFLSQPAEQIWYLGDSVEGQNLHELERMTDMQDEQFSKLGIPLCYVTGNHDFDYSYKAKFDGVPLRIPFYEMVQNHTGWRTTRSMEDTWFTMPLDENWQIFFFSDHLARDLSWLSTHNRIQYGHDVYPYGEEHWAEIRSAMADCGKRVITAAHCAFPGGNRDTEILGHIQPLPTNVRLHLYGHSHIGEYTWPKERAFCKVSWVDWQDIPQVDVASFENIRGSYCRSAILHVYDDNSLGIFFRNHDRHCFTDAFFPALDSQERDDDHQPGKPW